MASRYTLHDAQQLGFSDTSTTKVIYKFEVINIIVHKKIVFVGVQVLDIQEADVTTEQAVSLQTQIASQLTSSLSQDLIESYLSGIQKRAEISLNQQAINAVHANFQ